MAAISIAMPTLRVSSRAASARTNSSFSRRPAAPAARRFAVAAAPGKSRAVVCRSQRESCHAVQKEEPVNQLPELQPDLLLGSLLFSAPWLLDAQNALAADGEFGIFESSTTAALVHPFFEFILFGLTLYAGYTGYQWRRARTIGEEITSLKASLPATADATASPSPLDQQIEALTAERKELVKGGFRDKHWNAGSILLGTGVLLAVEGCTNTFMRTGRLFPGSHLYSGALIVVLWAGAAALVPAMQKGNETARLAHIGLNVVNVLLWVSQIPTGLEIVGKVFQFTTWP